jgi:hypothetical protein
MLAVGLLIKLGFQRLQRNIELLLPLLSLRREIFRRFLVFHNVIESKRY